MSFSIRIDLLIRDYYTGTQLIVIFQHQGNVMTVRFFLSKKSFVTAAFLVMFAGQLSCSITPPQISGKLVFATTPPQ